MLKRVLGLSIAVLGLATATASHALGGGCNAWGCGTNGTSVDGIAAEVVEQVATPSDRKARDSKTIEAIKRWGGCDEWGCGTNGTSVTGIALDRVRLQGLCIHPSQVDLPPAK